MKDFHGYAHLANPKPYATFGASEGYYNDAELSLGGLNVNMSYNDDGNTNCRYYKCVYAACSEMMPIAFVNG